MIKFHPNICHFHQLPHLGGKTNSKVFAIRFDELHPIISGNKIFKLSVHLQKALTFNKTCIVTKGGPYSNHIVAAAYAAQQNGLKSKGIISAYLPLKTLSHTLEQAQKAGMECCYISPNTFKNNEKLLENFVTETDYFIPEGGYSVDGMLGAAGMMEWIDTSFTHIICAMGTGTMFAGLAAKLLPHQQLIGVNVLKGYQQIINDVEQLFSLASLVFPNNHITILNDYHFGGYAKYSIDLLNCMNRWYQTYALPTDFVYTAKALYALEQLIMKDYFPPTAKIAFIHSGGLQGNLSLKKGTLLF
ncbi:MAG: 1-aminocyclopropane-1-carboxylate deaminase/D-cysteine desulfhydrase [Chitinophagaceae bacterium]